MGGPNGRRAGRAALLVLAGVLLPWEAFADPGPARAQSDLVVTKRADTNDGDCSPRDCSLREAILAANADPIDNFVRLPKGTFTLTLGEESGDANDGSGGDLDVTRPELSGRLVVFGAGARRTVVDASGIPGGGRAFDAIGGGADLTLQDLTVTGGDVGNQASGGGVRAVGRLTFFGVALRGNRAGLGGGASVEGSLSMQTSTVSGNAAVGTPNGDGGGLLLMGGTSVISNSTLSGNRTERVGGVGAAVALRDGASVVLSFTTVASNRTRDDEEGAIAGFDGTSATFGNSLFANAPTANCLSFLGTASTGHNLADDASCGLDQPSDLQPVPEPQLGPLRNNGGQTDTHALLRGSPARNAGPGGLPGGAIDQRGVKRPQGPAADIGAFEFKKKRRRR